MIHLILALNLTAFVSGAAAMACILVLGRQRPSRTVALTKYALMCMTFIAACNCIDFYLGEFAGLRDPRIKLLTMNLLSLATFASLALLFGIIAETTHRAFSPLSKFVFALQSFAVYLLCMAASLFGDPSGINASLGYQISALDAALCLLVAALAVFARNRLIEEENRRFVNLLAAFGLVWLVVDIGNEFFWWSALFSLPQIAMAPFFLIILSVCAIVRSVNCLSVAMLPKEASFQRDLGFPRDSLSPPGVQAGSSADIQSGNGRWDLSAREKDILALLVTGLENAEISERLFISPHTVKNHVSSIYRKSGAKNRLELIRMLGQSGEDSIPGK